jgi:tRNA (guanosine-2'-O-)-methyltransferase
MELARNVLSSWNQLKSKFTPARQQRMERVASQKSDRLRLVIQDVNSPHNVSACLRSAEAFGVLHVHVVTLQKFRPSVVAKGVSKWVHIHQHSSVAECVAVLRKEGFRLAAAMPRPDASSLDTLPLDTPLALVFGNEHEGVSSEWESVTDLHYTIPMVGMVESLNISVSAAISLYTTRHRIERQWKEQTFLSTAQQESLLQEWAKID